jgi:hypothetical protein
MVYIALGLFLLALGYFESAYRLAAYPLGVFFLLHGVGSLLHRRKRHVAGYFSTFLGVVSALHLLPILNITHKALLAAVAFGFFLSAARHFAGSLRRPLAPISIVVTSWALGAFLEAFHMPYVPSVVWGAGAGAAAASALGLLGGRLGGVGKFFARHTTFFGLLGALLVVTYYVSVAINRPWLFIAVTATSVAAVLLFGGDVRRKGAAARLYDDPDVLETKRVEAEFVKTGDGALLAAYVAYHLAKGGVDERKVVEAVRLAVSYHDIEPSPFAPPLVVRLVERLNRRRRRRHLQRVKAALRSYL